MLQALSDIVCSAAPRRVMETEENLPHWITGVLEAASTRLDAPIAFDVVTPAGARHRFGDATKPAFTLRIVDAEGLRALLSLDEQFAHRAYVDGSLAVEGDLRVALAVFSALSTGSAHRRVVTPDRGLFQAVHALPPLPSRAFRLVSAAIDLAIELRARVTERFER
jgi:hypothetical protein